MTKIRRWNEIDAIAVRRLKKEIHGEQDGKCYLCLRPTHIRAAELVHDIPRSVPGAGRNDRPNLRAFCTVCNSAKGDDNILTLTIKKLQLPDDYMDHDRLVWLARNHRNPGYRPELVDEAGRMAARCVA